MNYIRKYISKGERKSFAINRVSEVLDVPKNRVYALAHHSDDENIT